MMLNCKSLLVMLDPFLTLPRLRSRNQKLRSDLAERGDPAYDKRPWVGERQGHKAECRPHTREEE
eukprot:4199111-Pyramimonas_sp.AAC.1